MEDWTDIQDGDLPSAIATFGQWLPGWWFSLGSCSVSRHASCGPDRQGVDKGLLENKMFDEGFHADLSVGTLADALLDVMEQGLAARDALAGEQKHD